MSEKSVGILVCDKDRSPPFGDEPFYRELCRTGNRIGLSVFVFSPLWVQWGSRTTYGYAYDDSIRAWKKERYPLPKLIYDRSFFRNKKQLEAKNRLLRQLSADERVHFLGHPLKDKWSVYVTFVNDPVLRPHLPRTVKFSRLAVLANMLKTYKSVYVKPAASSKGKGVLRITKTNSGITIQGRTLQSEPVMHTADDLFVCYVWLQRFFQGRRFLIQPALNLITKDGCPYDIRVLMQKNHHGTWEMTGAAARIGRPESVTSNLHGGGIPFSCETFLDEQFGPEKRIAWMNTIQQLSAKAVKILEFKYGRLAEIGLDFGIEPTGNIWLIEANSKPGRSAFKSKRAVHEKAIEQPIHFAKYLLDRQ